MCLWSKGCFLLPFGKANISAKKLQKCQMKKCSGNGLGSHPIAFKLYSDQTNTGWNLPLIRLTQTKTTSDQTNKTRMWPLIRPSHSEVTSDHNILRSNQTTDIVVLVWSGNTHCELELGLIRGHFRLPPQLGLFSTRFLFNRRIYRETNCPNFFELRF